MTVDGDGASFLGRWNVLELLWPGDGPTTLNTEETMELYALSGCALCVNYGSVRLLLPPTKNKVEASGGWQEGKGRKVLPLEKPLQRAQRRRRAVTEEPGFGKTSGDGCGNPDKGWIRLGVRFVWGCGHDVGDTSRRFVKIKRAWQVPPLAARRALLTLFPVRAHTPALLAWAAAGHAPRWGPPCPGLPCRDAEGRSSGGHGAGRGSDFQPSSDLLPFHAHKTTQNFACSSAPKARSWHVSTHSVRPSRTRPGATRLPLGPGRRASSLADRGTGGFRPWSWKWPSRGQTDNSTDW